MSRETVRVVARLVARPEKADEMRALLASLLEPTRREPGCVVYELLQNRLDPTDFTFVEEWSDDASLDAHLASAHVQEALGRFAELAAAPPDIRRYRLVG